MSISPKDQPYIGEELELFERAQNWKRYFSRRLRPYVIGDVFEIGAGMGSNTPYLHRRDLDRWISIEPDARLCQNFSERKQAGLIPARCELVHGTLATLPPSQNANTIIYIDVLEHIEDDRGEIRLALERLRPNGHLLILCPAHDRLFSPFDRAIGHFRRYDRRAYGELASCRPIKVEYLDSVGMATSVANRAFLKQSYPTCRQIAFWDALFVPLSRLADPVLEYRVGKSILGVWKK